MRNALDVLVDAIVLVALVPLMAVAFILSIPPVVTVVMWRWRR